MNFTPAERPERIKKTKPAGADGHRSRMFDKFLKTDSADLTDRDIIEMLLFFTNRIRDTRGIAIDLFEAFDHDIGHILWAGADELKKVPGIGDMTSTLFEVLGELALRIDDDLSPLCESYSDTSKIGELFSKKHFCHNHDEAWAMFFNNDMRILAFEKIKNDQPLPEDPDFISGVLGLASALRSKKVAVARFSGDYSCYPTRSDFILAKQIMKHLNSSGISLIEYFIVTPDESLGITKMCL